jgi:ion channel
MRSPMHSAALVAGVVLIVVIMADAFEALVLPRRVTRRFRPARMFYRTTWRLWSAIARRMSASGRRETYLSFYGPLSLLLLLGAWAVALILGFALVHWAMGSSLKGASGGAGFLDDLYMSGTTFFTLGLGDVTPIGALPRLVTVIESGMGFGFLAAVIGYLPVVYQAFSRREVNITLLDARAGSPPSAGELLRRHADDRAALGRLLLDWERWSAEFLESHISYPLLSYYRSQHDNQSWLAALTTVLDATALVMTGLPDGPSRQARLTFAVARHAVVDLAQVLGTAPRPPVPDRLPAEALERLRARLAADGLVLATGAAADKKLAHLRELYEPYVNSLSSRLLMPLPSWGVAADATDNWRTTAWGEEHDQPPM